MIQKFRTKPVEIEAIRFTGDNHAEIGEWCNNLFVPKDNLFTTYGGFVDNRWEGQIYDELHATWINVAVGQWIVKGAKGELPLRRRDIPLEVRGGSMKLIGLSGYARSGKDETANVLVNDLGFVRVAFADKLREMLYQLNPVVDVLMDGPVYVKDVIDVYGWSKYKETRYGPEIRRLLQRLGTEAGRQTLWDSIWIDAALTGLPEDAKVVVTDCRFPNEADAIAKRGGEVWRVTRPNVGPVEGSDGSIHPSEVSLDEWNFDKHINNSGSLEQLADEVWRKIY